MTATPWRGDGQSLTTVFGEALEKVSLVDGMAMGYLSKVDYRNLCDNVDWDNMERISKQNLSIRDLNKRLFLPQRDEAVISEIRKVVKDIPNPKIAIFSPSIEHSNRFADMLSAAGIPCAALSRIDKAERRRRLLAFAAGTYQAVSAVDVMNEGIDIPDVNILCILAGYALTSDIRSAAWARVTLVGRQRESHRIGLCIGYSPYGRYH